MNNTTTEMTLAEAFGRLVAIETAICRRAGIVPAVVQDWNYMRKPALWLRADLWDRAVARLRARRRPIPPWQTERDECLAILGADLPAWLPEVESGMAILYRDAWRYRARAS